MNLRKIIHVDMDAFFAAVEQRNNPSFKGKPVIVGGRPEHRGVVCTCSYEARKYGIQSAMPSKTAVKLCPSAVFLTPNFSEYEEASIQINSIFRDYTDLIEPVSLDEAYLDVTVSKSPLPYATKIAREIKNRILNETGLTASAGVSFNKFLSKVASDYRKPDGLTVITPENFESFVNGLPIGKFNGIGRVTEKIFKDMGINTGEDLKGICLDELLTRFGKTGKYYYDIVRGIDDRPIISEWKRKSIGREHTLSSDTDDLNDMKSLLNNLSRTLAKDCEDIGASGKTLTLKVKFHDFKTVARSVTLPIPFHDYNTILRNAIDLLLKTEAGHKKIRLLGLSISKLLDDDELQDEMNLFAGIINQIIEPTPKIV